MRVYNTFLHLCICVRYDWQKQSHLDEQTGKLAEIAAARRGSSLTRGDESYRESQGKGKVIQKNTGALILAGLMILSQALSAMCIYLFPPADAIVWTRRFASKKRKKNSKKIISPHWAHLSALPRSISACALSPQKARAAQLCARAHRVYMSVSGCISI